MKNPPVLLKRILLAFWAVLLSIVFLTNLMDGAKAMGLLASSWSFASGNYSLIIQTTSRYSVPEWLNAVLFVAVICWEGMTAALFWLACCRFQGAKGNAPFLYLAFSAGTLLWAGFLIADEVFMAYALEGTHLRLLAAQLITLLAIELLPEKAN